MATVSGQLLNLLFLAPVVALADSGSVLLIDRALPPADTSPGISRVGWKAEGVLVTDHFLIGKPGELWVIDKVRTWAVPGLQEGSQRRLGDLFEGITLYGGLESQPPPATAEAAAAECACHGPTPIASTQLTAGSNTPSNTQITVGPVSYKEGGPYRAGNESLSIWQLEFANLRWNVPGGVNIGFGVLGTGRPSPNGEKPVWRNHAARDGGSHEFRLFHTNGSPVLPAGGDLPKDGSVGLNVQVWGHLSGRIEVVAQGKLWQVALLGGPGMDVNQVRIDTLRFGPNGARPLENRIEDLNLDGFPDLVTRTAAPRSSPGSSRLACLTGSRTDEVPFEACGVIPAR